MAPICVKGSQGCWPDSDRYLDTSPLPGPGLSVLSALWTGAGRQGTVSSVHTPQERMGCRGVQFLWTGVPLGFPTLGALTSGMLMNLGAQPCTRMGRPGGGGVVAYINF